MNLRWLLGNYADPEFHLTRRQQHAVTRLAHRRYLPRRRLLLWTAVMMLAGWAFLALVWDALAAVFLRLHVPQARAMSIAVICLAVSVGAAWLYRFVYARPVRMAMRELGFDVCVNCGYRLQGLGEAIERCPECGTNRTPLPTKEHAASGDDYAHAQPPWGQDPGRPHA